MLNSITDIAFGDSLALGTAQAAGIPCNAKIGRQPHEVLAAIRSTAPNFIAGRRVVLSSGLSNNPDGLSHVRKQVDALLVAGAALVILIGVGPGNERTNLAGVNDWLAELADRLALKVKFAGPLPCVRATGDLPGIHPWSYDPVVEQINAVLG